LKEIKTKESLIFFVSISFGQLTIKGFLQQNEEFAFSGDKSLKKLLNLDA